MEANENKITISICNRLPIELIDLTECLLGFGQQYVRHLQKHPELAEANDIRLFVKEVRQGSTVVDLVALAPLALPFISNANSLIGFYKHIQSFGGYLLGKQDKPEKLEKVDYEQYAKFTNPVAKDNAAQLNLSLVINGDVNVYPAFGFDFIEANAMQNAIARDLKDIKAPVDKIHRQVLLYWYQARNDSKTRAGDRAVIESIHPTALKTIFAIDYLKHEMLVGASDNPFHYAYIVDVSVETIHGKPTLYKILECHEKFVKPIENKDPQGHLF